MKKRLLAMLLTGAMTLSLAACGGTSTGSDAGTDSGADLAAIPTRSPSSSSTRPTHSRLPYPRLLRPRLTNWALT